MINLQKILLNYSDTLVAKTSSIQLNNLLGGGFKSNRIYHFYGTPNSGKSSLGLDIAYNTDKVVLYLNFDRKFLSIKRDNIIVMQIRDVKELFEILDLMPAVKIATIIIDSVPTMYSEELYKTQKYITNTLMATMYKMTTYFRKFEFPALILLNQIRSNIFNKINTITYAAKKFIDNTSHFSCIMMKEIMRDKYVITSLKPDYNLICGKVYPIKICVTNKGNLSYGFSLYVEETRSGNVLFQDNKIRYKEKTFNTIFDFITYYDSFIL